MHQAWLIAASGATVWLYGMWLKAHKSHTTLTWTMEPTETFDFARDSKVFQSYFWLRSTKHTQSAKRRLRLSLDLPCQPQTKLSPKTAQTSAWCGRIQLDVELSPSPWSNFFIPSPEQGEQSEQGIIILSRNVTECDTKKFSLFFTY